VKPLEDQIVGILERHGLAEMLSWELISTNEGTQLMLTPGMALSTGDERMRHLSQDLSSVEGIVRVLISIPS
jgi:hypothetical protein